MTDSLFECHGALTRREWFAPRGIAQLGTAVDIELDGQVLEAHTALHSLQRGARRPRGGELQVAVGEVAGRTANAGAAYMGATANTIHPTLHRDRTADPRPI